MKKTTLAVLSISALKVAAQQNKADFTLHEGVFIAGYVDGGAFLNFTGPNVCISNKNSKLILGMLPSLRIKNDNRTPKNALVTLNLGIGLTYSYKAWAIQTPLYYNAKTATQNGNW